MSRSKHQLPQNGGLAFDVGSIGKSYDNTTFGFINKNIDCIEVQVCRLVEGNIYFIPESVNNKNVQTIK